MGYSFPKFYDEINVENGIYSPSNIQPCNNEAYAFWLRALFQRLQSKIGIEGWPTEWDLPNVKNFFEFILLARGYLAVTKNDKYGLFFATCEAGGKMNLYFQPTQAFLRVPESKTKLALTIGKDCELAMLTPDYRGLMDICAYYAYKLALNDVSVDTSLLNSKLANIIGAKTKAAAEALKHMVDKINKGEGLAVFDKRIQNDPVSESEPFTFLKLFEASDFITDKLLDTHATLLAQFDAEVGIKNIPYKKMERMVKDEADSKTQDSMARISVWIDTLNESFKRINKAYGLNLKAYINEIGGGEDGKDDLIRSREISEQSE